MTLPYPAITKFPENTRTPAIPQSWNTRYVEIDANFTNHESRVAAAEAEVAAARGGKANINARLNEIELDITGLDPDMQNMVQSVLLEALCRAATAQRDLDRTLNQRFQRGRATIINRGVVKGCTVTKSSNATRNCSMAAGMVFIGGTYIPVSAETNGAAVPGNSSATAKECYLYLAKNLSNVYEMYCTELGASVPAGGLALYRVTVPAGNIEATDPYIANCTLTDMRRVESNKGIYATTPFVYVALPYALPSADYSVDIDIVSYDGSGFELGDVYVKDRAYNGFKLCLDGCADNVDVRWTVKKLDM